MNIENREQHFLEDGHTWCGPQPRSRIQYEVKTNDEEDPAHELVGFSVNVFLRNTFEMVLTVDEATDLGLMLIRVAESQRRAQRTQNSHAAAESRQGSGYTDAIAGSGSEPPRQHAGNAESVTVQRREGSTGVPGPSRRPRVDHPQHNRSKFP